MKEHSNLITAKEIYQKHFKAFEFVRTDKIEVPGTLLGLHLLHLDLSADKAGIH